MGPGARAQETLTNMATDCDVSGKHTGGDERHGAPGACNECCNQQGCATTDQESGINKMLVDSGDCWRCLPCQENRKPCGKATLVRKGQRRIQSSALPSRSSIITFGATMKHHRVHLFQSAPPAIVSSQQLHCSAAPGKPLTTEASGRGAWARELPLGRGVDGL